MLTLHKNETVEHRGNIITTLKDLLYCFTKSSSKT
jgi:uncharacterized protein YdeI (BOF family)